MNYRTPQSLLSLPPEMNSPDAYRVLGLTMLEADREVIKAAAEQVVTHLRERRQDADEAAWTIAAQWVKNAFAILNDGSKKAAYDRKLAAEQARLQAADPLASVLPQSVSHTSPLPAAAATPSVPAQAAPTRSNTFETAGSTAVTSPVIVPALPDSSVQQSVPQPSVTVPVIQRAVRSRKRGLPWGMIFMSLFCLACMGGIGAVLYVLQKSDGRIVVNLGGGAASGIDFDGDGKTVVEPRDIADREKPAYDPVMGGLAGDMPAPSRPEEVDGFPTDDFAREAMRDEPSMMPSMTDDTMQDAPAMVPEIGTPSMEETPAVPAPVNNGPMPGSVPTDTELASAKAAIDSLTAAIKAGDWSQMKALLGSLLDLPMDAPLQEQAEGLMQLADLAVYYHGGIEKGMSQLKAGDEFVLPPDLTVVIVEATAEKLVIRFNGKNKEFSSRSLPLSLSHQFAGSAMPGDSPTVRAAKYSFQAIAPGVTAAYREEAIKELESITGDVEGADPAKLVATIRDLYQL